MKTLIDNYYSRTHKRWRIDEEKAGKDIVGEEYELMRKTFWVELGYTAKSEKIANYNADLVVRDDGGQIVVIEEDKAHYVDSCFLDRFMMNAARVLQHYIDSERSTEQTPFIVLSCMTKYKLFDEKYESNKKMFSQQIQNLMEDKVRYFPLCNHDRVKADKYFKSNDNCFTLDNNLVQNQDNFVKKTLQEGV